MDLTNPSPEMIVAISSVVLSLASGLVSTRASLKVRTQEQQIDAKHRARQLLQEYRDPLVDAAHTLQARLYNIVENDYLGRYFVRQTDEAQRDYARDYTVYAIAEYLTWVEILRREMRFEDLGEVEETRNLLHRLNEIQKVFQSDKLPGRQFEIFRGRQRAIAEVMMRETGAKDGPRNEPIGYATFCQRLATDAQFAVWFVQLQRDVETVAHATAEENARLAFLQRELVALMDVLDKDKVKVQAAFRKPLPEPSAAIPVPR